jgi:hypothetical protein
MLRSTGVLLRTAIAARMNRVAWRSLFPPLRTRTGLSPALIRCRLGPRVFLRLGLESTWFAFVHNSEISAADVPVKNEDVEEKNPCGMRRG